MNFRQLSYFVAIADCGTMNRAAEQLRVAQTALGAQIKLLEEELGVALLERHSRGIEPTKAGRLLYARAREILALVDAARQEVANCEKKEPEAIRMGITPALMLVAGTEIAVTTRETIPQVSLRIVEAMSHVLIDMLQRGEVDFILCYDIPDHPQLARTALLQDDLVLVKQPEAGAKAEPVTFTAAIAHTLAMPEEGDSVRTSVTRIARDLGLQLQVAYEVRSIAAMKMLVAKGAAAAILPFASVVEEVRDGTLDARPIANPAVRRTLFLGHSRAGGPFRNTDTLTAAVRSSLSGMIEALGPLAHKL